VTHTQFVAHRERGFWAYDVALAVLLKHMIDVAEERRSDVPWLAGAASAWRVVACVSDYGLTLDPDWSAAQLQAFSEVVEEACGRVSARTSIPAQELATWRLLDDCTVLARGNEDVSTAPIVELGEAIVALSRGALPMPPGETLWFYGVPTGRSTLPCGSSER